MIYGAYVTVKFRIDNVIHKDDLKKFGDFSAVVKDVIESDGLWSSVEEDYEIVSIKKFKDAPSTEKYCD